MNFFSRDPELTNTNGTNARFEQMDNERSGEYCVCVEYDIRGRLS